ncbi:hypothetical protein MN116_007197 [Schistosoma mekongi]|uniref:Uncharacterized protein n=1 Tax=Schistosoma mekongi TaxID=38744 RepID=A0AAE1Z987_SCHME|nr:hypothetical protein MN116_007197 [Schistosoma mekongi]
MSNSQLHPAFYASRRQLWATLSTGKVSCCWKFIQNNGIGSNCISLSSIWYLIFTISSILWLLVRAIWRYKDFKAQAYDPRFGNKWDEINTLHFQLACIIFSLCLFPIMIYSALCRVGHSANDSVILGKDMLHLQNLLLSFPTLQKISSLHTTVMNGNNGSRYSSTALPNGGGITRSREQQSSLEDDALDSFIIKKRGEDFYEQITNHFKPFSAILYVLITYLFLLPICIMEAEQIKNEAIDPRYVFQSSMDRIFGQSASERYTTFLMQHIKTKTKQNLNNPLRDDGKMLLYENERPFPSHVYPTTPSEISVEYACFIISLFMLTIQYAAPFYFTSRIFSLLFTMYIALTSVYLLVDVETIAVLYKLNTVGIRDPGGSIIIYIDTDLKYITSWYCVLLSAAGLPAMIICLMAIYAYGETKFKEAVTNYAQLLIAGEIPSIHGTSSIKAARGNLIKTVDYDANNHNPDSNATIETMIGEQIGLESAYQESIINLPITLAITTKHWHPPLSNRRNGQLPKRSNTPLPYNQSQNNGSEMSTSLKRGRGIPLSTSTELSNSVHTLNETSNSSSKSTQSRWSRIGLSIIATFSFIWVSTIRICLMGSILKCYWKTGLEIALADTILTVLYMICWLILWFGLSVKTAWRFRLLHNNYLASTGQRDSFLQKGIFPNGCDNQAFGSPEFQQQIHMNVNGAYPNLWPYVSYPPWIAPGTVITAGLPVGTTGDLQQANNVVNGLTVGGGSGGDSLYGCFPDLTNQTQNPSADVANQYHPHSRCISLPSGPPTLSEESDITANQHEQNGCTNNNKYFRPVTTPSLTGSAYLNDNHQTPVEIHHPYTTLQNNNLPRSRTIQEISYSAAYEQFPGQNSSRNRGIVSNSSHTNNQRHRVSPMIPEPTYATLATLSKQSVQNNAFRPNSVTPLDQHNKGRTSPTNISRNISYRRPCTRVTFQDIDNNFSGSRIVINDGATGSSDSGVCTNGHGSSIQQNDNYSEKQYQKGKIKPELYDMFEPDIYQKPGVECAFDRDYTNVNVKDGNMMKNSSNIVSHHNNNNDVEISTDMTSFAMKRNHKRDECISYGSHNDTPNNLQINSNYSHQIDPDDRLCSQV